MPARSLALVTLLAAAVSGLCGCDPGLLDGNAFDDDGGRALGRPDGGSGGFGDALPGPRPDGAGPGPGADAGPPPAQPTIPPDVRPCASGSCYSNLPSFACGADSHDEDYASGKYNVHRYSAQLSANGRATITLAQRAGSVSPALVVIAQPGNVMLSDGKTGRHDSGFEVVVHGSGRNAGSAHVEVRNLGAAPVGLEIYATTWGVIDGGFVTKIPQDVRYTLAVDNICITPQPGGSGVAPQGAMPGEKTFGQGSVAITGAANGFGSPIRIDAAKGEHVGFQLSFSPTSTSGVKLQVLRWDGAQAQPLGTTTSGGIGGSGKRWLAVLDSTGDRTYWVRMEGQPSSATLQVTRTPFVEGRRCTSDCARLLQLPLANDPQAQGYGVPPGVRFAYQFGRRDLLMFLRYAGRVMVQAGVKHFTVKDISKFGGARPPGHASHTDGKDVDIGLFTADGTAIWKTLCKLDSANGCVAGTVSNYGASSMARMLGAIFESNRVDKVFLDRQMIPPTESAAQSLAQNGGVDPATLPLFAKRSVLQHWPNHHHHVHIRIKLGDY